MRLGQANSIRHVVEPVVLRLREKKLKAQSSMRRLSGVETEAAKRFLVLQRANRIQPKIKPQGTRSFTELRKLSS